jgi:UDP-N-acetyl-D-glucosamine dehydrogenase
MSDSSASPQSELARKIESSQAVIGVIGLGYVGLPLLAAFHRAGYRVIGFDKDPKKIDALGRGENYLGHLGESLVRDMVGERFRATSDSSAMGDCDVLLSCVPTPLGQHLEPDLTYVANSAADIAKTLRSGQLIVLESSTYPRTTREIMLPQFEAKGLTLGEDFFVAYSPEREDPGSKTHDTTTIPKLVGGVTPEAGELAVQLYRTAIRQVIPVASAEVAEAAKILENVYRAVNIALVNELKVILTAMDVDVWEVIDAAATKPFGFQAFYPGPGLGGHCIPIDPFYLTWAAREHGQTTRFIELAGQINHHMPDFVVQRCLLALNEHGKAAKGAKVLVLGLAYKPDIDDVRESPSFKLIEQLRRLGAEVDYHDPHVPATHAMRHYPDLPPMASIELSDAALAGYDLAIVATHHSAYDWNHIAQHAKLIVDTRGVFRDHPGQHIVSA